jgi:hypothetical protein
MEEKSLRFKRGRVCLSVEFKDIVLGFPERGARKE